MQHRIFVFNQDTINGCDGENIRQKLLNANHESLCEQYKLDPALIALAITNLDVIVSDSQFFPYFLVRYGEGYGQSFIVYQWNVEKVKIQMQKKILFFQEVNKSISGQLQKTRNVVEIELAPNQLQNLGLLFAYEIARWAASVAQGVILGLDNVWYRLNHHLAFIPIAT